MGHCWMISGSSVETLNRMLAGKNFNKKITEERYRDLFGFPVKGFYESLGYDFDRDDWDAGLGRICGCIREFKSWCRINGGYRSGSLCNTGLRNSTIYIIGIAGEFVRGDVGTFSDPE